MEYIITALIALLSGAIGSLFAPWIHWSIEKKKLNRKKQEDLLDFITHNIMQNDPRSNKFLNSLEYIKIRPYLTNEFVAKLENKSTTVFTTNQYRNYYQSEFLSEIHRIEKLWGIPISSIGMKTEKFNKTNSENSTTITISRGS